jgi:hypothetical protein
VPVHNAPPKSAAGMNPRPTESHDVA